MRTAPHPALLGMALLSLSALLAGCGGDDSPPGGTGPAEEPPLPTYDYPLDDVLRLNQLQAKGTHNSYHMQPANEIPEWSYTHAPLDAQLATQGVRAIELDIWYNDGDKFFEVFHVGGVDDVSTCRRFTDCLKAVKAWSDAHPAHHPVFVQLEPKDAFYPEQAAEYWERLEGEILSVWPPKRIVTPDDVKGDAGSIREAITTAGWPTLGEVRARVLFFLNEGGDFRADYTRGGSHLDGRLFFVESEVGEPAPYDALYVLNSPLGDAAAIADAVAGGFLVRTRADSDSAEPLAGDTARRDAALASGAQIVSTDYPAAVAGVDYTVEIPGGTPSRCNPVASPPECAPEAVENPDFIAMP